MQFVVCGGRGGNEADLDSVETYFQPPIQPLSGSVAECGLSLGTMRSRTLG
jgi:hypothetical protein